MLSSPISLFFFGLLLLAHAIGDFVLQTENVALGKARHARLLLLHILHHVAAMSLLLVLAWLVAGMGPDFISLSEGAAVVASIAAAHWLIDRLKILADRRLNREVWTFLADQFLHVIILWTAVVQLQSRHPGWALAQVPPVAALGQSVAFDALVELALWLGGVILAVRGGAILVHLLSQPLRRAIPPDVLQGQGIPPRPLGDERTLIQGYVERFAALILLLTSFAWLVAAMYVLKAILMRRRLRAEGNPDTLRHWLSLEYSASLGTVLVVGIGLKILLA